MTTIGNDLGGSRDARACRASTLVEVLRWFKKDIYGFIATLTHLSINRSTNILGTLDTLYYALNRPVLSFDQCSQLGHAMSRSSRPRPADEYDIAGPSFRSCSYDTSAWSSTYM